MSREEWRTAWHYARHYNESISLPGASIYITPRHGCNRTGAREGVHTPAARTLARRLAVKLLAFAADHRRAGPPDSYRVRETVRRARAYRLMPGGVQ